MQVDKLFTPLLASIAALVLAPGMFAQDASTAVMQGSPVVNDPPGAGATTIRVSVSSEGQQGQALVNAPTISANGNCVAFISSIRNFRPDFKGIGQCVFVRDLEAEQTDRLDIEVEGKPMSVLTAPAISADGSIVAAYVMQEGAFPMQEMVAPDARIEDIVLFRRSDRTVIRVDPKNHGVAAPIGPYPLALASDGSAVIFQTTADFSKGINTAMSYRFDVQSHDVAALTHGVAGAENLSAMHCSMSSDGQLVAFQHMSNARQDSPPLGDYVLDRKASTISPMTPAQDPAAKPRARMGCISPNGRCFVYTTADDAGVPDDSNHHLDVALYDRDASTMELVSVPTAGGAANDDSEAGANEVNPVSADNRFVVFSSKASNLVPDDTNGARDVFLRDRKLKRTIRVSVAADGTESNGDSGGASVSLDGHRVAFWSAATNLVPGDTNGVKDVFVRELAWDEAK